MSESVETAVGGKSAKRSKNGSAPARKGLVVERVWTTEGTHPYDEVTWERRDVVMTNWRDGSINFEQRGVEFPGFWSVNATNIVTSKYFRGAVGTDNREWSLKQLIDRVVKTYRKAGEEHGYFATGKDARVFEEELTWLLLHQYFSFNSPVWFNVGTPSPQQVSACFILSVDDSMDSILDWYKEEGLIFKGGSGSGVNLSKIRSSKELLSSGGNASGPVSFMRGADASAGTIKSGGATRRAAKMVVLDVDHPDIEEFIETKAREEDKIRALRDAGFDMDLGGKDIVSVQYQNANNSVRVSDEFMTALENGTDFPLRARLDGSEIERVDAKRLFRKMAEAAWECADPGIQYDDTINDWHTNPETGRITASNPCFPADQRVVTDKGLIRIGDLVARAAAGEKFAVYTNDVTAENDPQPRVLATDPTRYMVTGTNPIIRLEFSDGSELRCTPNHRLWTSNRGWVHAKDLTDTDRVVRSYEYAPRTFADWSLPANAVAAAEVAATGKAQALDLPEKWTSELAHYLGWLVGDGSLTDVRAVTVYGGEDEQRELLPRHQDLLTRLTGHTAKPSVQANGTLQLRAGQRALRDFLAALGVSSGRAADKVVPEAIFEAPEPIVVDFLQGLFDADGCAVELANGTRYVGLASRSKKLLRGVQELLASLGIAGRIYETGTKADSFRHVRKDGTEVTYSSDGPMYDLRVSGRGMREFGALIDFSLPAKQRKLTGMLDFRDVYRKDETVTVTRMREDGFETTYNLTEPRNHSYIVSGVVVANCSEYLSLDNSSCNLASLNLLKFLNEDGSFDTEKFVKAVEFVITAMEISISFADFPTEKIGETTRDYRQLGIGYANLGALLMASGMAYDSEDGRALAAAITAVMTGVSYRRSAEIAGVVGPYAGYARNAEAHQRVMRKHAAAVDQVQTGSPMARGILAVAAREWKSGNGIGEVNGWRNAQASVLAPTGTISFMMDSDTTGIEPDLALVKFKKLVGGGSMQIVNQTVPRALRTLGYQEEQVEAIVEYIGEHGHVVDAPGLKHEHYSVFDCAMGERSIAAMGHVKMMAAVQPFISGAISKTVNVPETATVEDFEHIYFEGWKLGLKALAVYRDNCKVGQPLSAAKKPEVKAETAVEAKPVETTVEYRPVRKRLPKKRPSQTVSFSVGGAEGYLTASSYPDNGLGEVFFKMSKQGSTLAGIMDAFSVAISIALQYGVPLEKYVEKFTNMRFEPAGMTDDPDIRMAASVVDYLFRRLALDYLPFQTRADLGILTAAERAAEVRGEDPASVHSDEDDVDFAAMASSAPIEKVVEKLVEQSPRADVGSSTELLERVQGKAADAPLCMTCGTKMRPAGSCYVCEGCGSTSGCS
ncbi:ribonucleoside-diphosphate reductase alpha chain [Stackebrandtia albiflava]|uniref:Vitamin B12-dependent ribonucleotide reductase n=1 Tax=Stackebrandtia albiflava TaxID=406432 RepID=A0A562VBG7_9ACTN|nr:vitamin B12-dependent ribonucleotide reductase [Stackebrandtia albiflava]TWJ15167.1 ribonucleoside-diphosphate reductase alpha chain [Stackebrandtia albiflava]